MSIRPVLLLLAAVAAPAPAVDATAVAVRSSVYLALQFGGAQARAGDLHYGLRIGSAAQDDDLLAPPAFRLDFSPGLLPQATLGGLPLTPRLAPVLGADEAPAPWYDITSWGATQWGVIVGGGIIGYAVAADRDQDPAPETRPAPSATSSAPVNPCAPDQVPEIGGGCLDDVGFAPSAESRLGHFATRKDSSWLDEGTGQMGDLIPR